MKKLAVVSIDMETGDFRRYVRDRDGKPVMTHGATAQEDEWSGIACGSREICPVFVEQMRLAVEFLEPYRFAADPASVA